MINIYIIYFSEDHLVKTQAMRGSPYFKPFEKEVLGWDPSETSFEQLVKLMVKHDLELAKNESTIKKAHD